GDADACQRRPRVPEEAPSHSAPGADIRDRGCVALLGVGADGERGEHPDRWGSACRRQVVVRPSPAVRRRVSASWESCSLHRRRRGGAYVESSVTGHLLFLSGMLPVVNGTLAVAGRLGDTRSVEDGQESARIAALNALAP